MFRYGQKSAFPGKVLANAGTKYYQHLFLKAELPKYVTPKSRVMEVGANVHFAELLSLKVAERWAADPYDGKAGGGAEAPPPVPRQIIMSRCAIGVNSNALPSNFFDLVFSSSVLEHVGQRAARFDCRPTDKPPMGQEVPRRNLCEELFRITKPGGVQIHTIDHGARNFTYYKNFLRAGFVPLIKDPQFTVEQMMADPDAIRQTKSWRGGKDALPNPELHTFLILGFRKPVHVRRPRVTVPANVGAKSATSARPQAATLASTKSRT